MAERRRNGADRSGSAINRILNRIAEAVGLGSSESDREDATGGAAGGITKGTGAGARLNEDDPNNRGTHTVGGGLDR